MITVGITAHAMTRMQQRGVKWSDIDYVMSIGTEIGDGYVILERDYRAIEHEMKRQLQNIKRLVGKRIVCQQGKLITAYPMTKNFSRRLLKDA